MTVLSPLTPVCWSHRPLTRNRTVHNLVFLYFPCFKKVSTWAHTITLYALLEYSSPAQYSTSDASTAFQTPPMSLVRASREPRVPQKARSCQHAGTCQKCATRTAKLRLALRSSHGEACHATSTDPQMGTKGRWSHLPLHSPPSVILLRPQACSFSNERGSL